MKRKGLCFALVAKSAQERRERAREATGAALGVGEKNRWLDGEPFREFRRVSEARAAGACAPKEGRRPNMPEHSTDWAGCLLNGI